MSPEGEITTVGEGEISGKNLKERSKPTGGGEKSFGKK